MIKKLFLNKIPVKKISPDVFVRRNYDKYDQPTVIRRHGMYFREKLWKVNKSDRHTGD
ncbi:MAG: hypothetical protein Q7U98_03360 [Methylicorpusculum sp.]|uniref:hypothetical protein n=1 Tax=Methylicorpusculum sp. TaxID=2713644 RepID=UPI00271E602A|nr:hypothetical protein [Methylicorpusculum sp.]MDO8938177.1 hypothetical protein [Methylicorpusculum sp.]